MKVNGPNTYCPLCGRIVGTFYNGQFKPHPKREGIKEICSNSYKQTPPRHKPVPSGHIDGSGI